MAKTLAQQLKEAKEELQELRKNFSNYSSMMREAGAKVPPGSQTPRAKLLAEATRLVLRDRNSAYGDPEDNFVNIANFWNHYLTTRFGCAIVLTGQDVAMLNILQKTARLAGNPNHRDSLVDIVGYAACAEDCRTLDDPLMADAQAKMDEAAGHCETGCSQSCGSNRVGQLSRAVK